MTNQERLEKYLVGNKSYLKENISNGKTHFWQNKLQYFDISYRKCYNKRILLKGLRFEFIL